MLRVGLLALLLAALGGPVVAGPLQMAQAEPLSQADPSPPIGEPMEIDAADSVVPEDAAGPPNCAADAVDPDRGVFGAGEGATRQAAIDAALKQCRDSGGKSCSLGSVACNPNASKARANRAAQ